MTALASLRAFARDKTPTSEKCELCGAALGSRHHHLVEPASRRLLCTCEACSVVVGGSESSSRYARVPRTGRYLADFQLSEAEWESLMIPVGMAFFFRSTPLGKVVAIYPSAAGPTESLLGLDAWQQIAGDNPALDSMKPDVEALLVNRISSPREYYIAPMDRCYELVGVIRMYWRGLSGGKQVREEIQRFFAALKEQSQCLS